VLLGFSPARWLVLPALLSWQLNNHSTHEKLDFNRGINSKT